MSGSSAASHRDIKSVLESKPLKFRIKTGGGRWVCQIHADRHSYERSKPARFSSGDSINSSSTATSK